jgi:serine/threonine protein kinase
LVLVLASISIFSHPVGDFGLSLLESRGIIVTGRKGIVGSALYQAPEALMDREDDITEKTDVWAFGLIFWEIITRQKVFDDFDQKGDLDVCDKLFLYFFFS